MRYSFFVHRTVPRWRLVIAESGSFPGRTTAGQWQHTRDRAEADTNPDVRAAVARQGFCLGASSASFDELDRDLRSALAPPSRGQERVVAEFRSNGGQVGGYHASRQLLLLTTAGGRTGQRRAVPLTYLPDGDRYIVTAGDAGSGRNPAWYHHLTANPEVTLEVGHEAFAARAAVARDAERDALYERFAAACPQAAGYPAQTSRQIPVVIFTRRHTDA